MASGGPVMNGDISRSAGQSCPLEETLQQMHILIQENRELKEALRQTNMTMKERFEDLSAWREKQRQERDFLESRLEEARGRMEELTLQNQELSTRRDGRTGAAPAELLAASSNQNRAELDALCAQIARLQAEKNDLVSMNSELQLKADQDSHDDSFIEIIRVSDEGVNGVCGLERSRRPDLSMAASRLESEEMTVSQLLQSLRNETQRAERLQAELQFSAARIRELEERKTGVEKATQTPEAETKEDSGKEEKAASEVENLKSQTMTLFKELQQAQSKLDEAEGMKKNLQDRCREVEQDVVTLKAQLVEKQAVQTENDRLKLQVDSMQAQSLIEQRKNGEERNNLAQLKDAYTKLYEDYNELMEEKKKRESVLVQKAVVDELQDRLSVAEEALAVKQNHIDNMKQEIFSKEEELQTISVFQAQAEVYSSDFYAERAAREKLHEERERLAAQLEYVKKQNSQLQEELDSLGRHSLNEMQKRHVSLGGNPHGAGASLVGRGTNWQHQGNIPEHACPKCNEILPDLDSLQIHIMDCIN
ncbi:optineurin [Cyclopterus lumpus]|uniref:Optineurin n=1 Tax=Cyclopterus lumpus TaxID=8103 RepID=A0A8C3ALY8_CYCLU|nr:optineurin [Cyclopterus lumpus]XP_034382568.1 optineurin [Cyclopterus lumpus]XP_034382569.1 optineurin [Cyclopterus lumpus]XP_034382570.1 optineurin [Cyclopterus lumpus]XP_034382571.1 optineurin [Cyclopterus lumpus]